MQQGRNSSGGQGVPDRAAEEQATTRGRKMVRKAFQGRIFLRDCCRFSPGTAYIVPLTHACVRGLPCFLVVCCAPARAAHASAHICGVGSDRSRVRSRYVCVPCKRCTAGCLGTKSGTVRAHFGPMTSFMVYLKPSGPYSYITGVFKSRGTVYRVALSFMYS